MLHFDVMTEEWLDFIVACRNGCGHDFDIVEGPMADDQIFNYIQNFNSALYYQPRDLLKEEYFNGMYS